MSKRWTLQDDIKLVGWGAAIDYDYVAFHDLGFAHGAGSKRIKKLEETGVLAAIECLMEAEEIAKDIWNMNFAHGDRKQWAKENIEERISSTPLIEKIKHTPSRKEAAE